MRALCAKVLEGEPCSLNSFIDDHMGKMEIDMESLEFNELNFEERIKGIIRELFSSRPASTPYVLVVLMFAKKINCFMLGNGEKYGWYSKDSLIDIITGLLEATGYDPMSSGQSSWCTIL